VKELEPIFKAIGDFFGNPVFQLATQAAALYVVILWLAASYWAFRDMQQRSDNPVLPYLASAFIIVFTPVLFVFAVLVYRLIRPHEKIGETYERNLAEQALLNEIEAIPHCPTCDGRIHEDWLICPNCRTRLKRVCPNCDRLVGVEWSLCAWCGRDFERREAMAGTIEPLPTKREARAAHEQIAREVSAAPAPREVPLDLEVEERVAGDVASARPSIRRGASHAPMTGTRSTTPRPAIPRQSSDPLAEP
jgi:hypothetical protein